ncbi:MAG: Rne/Rng family ribonuclease [Deltaproteobacteria bacterium]|jgi:ribonuclease G|nr:Rne/Rng family ribonuclease [Deltaproteobacteria bacterium]
MTSELLINHRPYETRTALVENGETVEFRLERAAGRGLSGSVYKGRVVRVIPGLQAAFVDIGLEKAAFLYVDDLSPSGSGLSRSLGGPSVLDAEVPGRDGRGGADDDPDGGGLAGLIEGLEGLELNPTEASQLPKAPIESLISEGQELLVQVSREPMGQKGARVTTLVSLPGRRLVLLSAGSHLGVSKRIEGEGERARLRSLLEASSQGAGFIARTAAEGAADYEIRSEASFLIQLWDRIREDARAASAPALIHRELDLALRAVRDVFTDRVERLVVDDPAEHVRIGEFLSAFAPDLLPALTLYGDPTPLFHAFNVETDLARALSRKVWLKSGGYLVIDATEALTVIDVNTGRYVGRRCLEETVLKTNLEAVREIALQLRLRNTGGLIVIDFIDMEREASRERVTAALREALRRDRGAAKVLPMSELCVVEMTRKRTRENIDRLMRVPCWCCQGQGSLLTGASVCHQALRELELAAADCPRAPLTLKVHPSVRDHLLEEGRAALEDLERRIGFPVTVKADPGLHPETAEVEIARGPDAGSRETFPRRPRPDAAAPSAPEPSSEGPEIKESLGELGDRGGQDDRGEPGSRDDRGEPGSRDDRGEPGNRDDRGESGSRDALASPDGLRDPGAFRDTDAPSASEGPDARRPASPASLSGPERPDALPGRGATFADASTGAERGREAGR